MNDEFTPHEIAAALRDADLESADHDLYLDIQEALSRLPENEQSMLRLYRTNLSPVESARQLGLKSNPQRVFNRALRLLTGILNGKEISVWKGKRNGI